MPLPTPPVPNRIVIGDNELGVTHLGGGPEAHRDGQQGQGSQVLMLPNVLPTNMCTRLPHSTHPKHWWALPGPLRDEVPAGVRQGIKNVIMAGHSGKAEARGSL